LTGTQANPLETVFTVGDTRNDALDTQSQGRTKSNSNPKEFTNLSSLAWNLLEVRSNTLGDYSHYTLLQKYRNITQKETTIIINFKNIVFKHNNKRDELGPSHHRPLKNIFNLEGYTIPRRNTIH